MHHRRGAMQHSLAGTLRDFLSNFHKIRHGEVSQVMVVALKM